MSYLNYDDVLDQLLAGGLKVDTVKTSRGGVTAGQLVVGSTSPVRCETEDSTEKRGWYWISVVQLPDAEGRLEDYLIGSYGIYHANDNGKQNLKLKRDGRPSLSPAEKDAMRTRLADQAKKAKALRAAEAKKAADEADRCWRKYLPTGESDYLKRKGVQAHGLRFSPSGNGTVAVPMLRDGRVVGLQIIRGKDRGNKLEKQYWPAGMDKVGAYHLIGGIPRGLVLVAEGYATAATLHETTNLPVAVAFDAGSLMPVVAELAQKYRTSKILICADDDYLTPGNPGCEAARLAATAHGAAWCKPIFAKERSTTKKGPTDYNDLANLEGPHVVAAQIAAHLESLGWKLPRARELTTGGQGELPSKAILSSLISVDEACDRFALIYGGKGTLFDHQEHLLVPKSDVLDIIPDHGWREWKLRQDRKVVRLSEVGFDPACTDKTIRCNLWGGWPTEPKTGKCEVLLDLLRYLCSAEQNSADLFTWAIRWLAYPIQHPGAKMRTALIFHGPQGTGKNLFFEAIMAIYGEYGRIVGQAEIEDKFNDWASRKLFLIADEVVARQELYHVKNKLKSFVTGEWIRINPKNVAAHDERNHCNVVYLSNETQPLPIEQDDRRHFVIWTPAKLSADFYQDVRDEINTGGIAALHQYLLDIDLGDFDEHTKPPETQAKRDLIEVGAGNVQRFIKAWLGGDTSHPVCPCGSSDLYLAYTRWCREDGVRNPREANQFIGEIAKLPGWEKGHKDRYDNLLEGPSRNKLRQRFIIPSLETLTQGAKLGADYRKTDTQNQTEWLTDCFFAFTNSLPSQS
ncbi:MAG: DNA primase [Azonexus sp.]|nr:DNA primase [Azonexus sp.]